MIYIPIDWRTDVSVVTYRENVSNCMKWIFEHDIEATVFFGCVEFKHSEDAVAFKLKFGSMIENYQK